MDKIPQSLLVGFAGIGALWLGSKIVTYVQLLLSLFVLPGKNVCLKFDTMGTPAMIYIFSCEVMARKAPGLLLPVPPMA
jgi:17beta-estradiol 17-dehydrogenase / very-long-chain 3-oxoacyl-CoA reductase